MRDFIQDTMFGKVVRFATKGKYLQYAEERDPSLWQQYLDRQISRQVAIQNTLRPSQGIFDRNEEHRHSLDVEKSLDGSDANTTSSARVNQPNNTKADPERGSDVLLITWFSPNDSDVCIGSSPPQNRLTMEVESAKLVHGQEVLRHLRDLSLDI